MRRRWWAYAAYAVGSLVFLVASLDRGSALLIAGSALFLLGTLLFAVPEVWRARAGRRERATGSGSQD